MHGHTLTALSASLSFGRQMPGSWDMNGSQMQSKAQVVVFFLISGAGWLFDFCLFWLFIAQISLAPGVANFLSATLAAMSVFVVARKIIFRVDESGLRSHAIYFAYTEANIVGWAMLIQLLAGGLATGLCLSAHPAALIAKVVVTPLSLACNFMVSKWLSANKM